MEEAACLHTGFTGIASVSVPTAGNNSTNTSSASSLWAHRVLQMSVGRVWQGCAQTLNLTDAFLRREKITRQFKNIATSLMFAIATITTSLNLITNTEMISYHIVY